MAAPTATSRGTSDGRPAAPVLDSRSGFPTLATAVGAGFVLWGLLIGIQPLHDNSFLTHLATGRVMLDEGGIPRVDPYSFTAPGEPWVVQSWLASLFYGLADAVGGLDGVRVLNALLVAGLALLAWKLAAAARLLPRVVIVACAASLGVGLWVERPLLFGLIAMALVLLLAEGRADPRWAVPVMWVWVNTHGSFPLGLVAVALLALGARLDGERRPHELTVLAWMGVGTLVAAVNPLGPKLLLFPLEVFRRSESFRVIQEWQPLHLDGVWPALFLVQVVVAILLLARSRSWRAAVPLLVFTAMAIMSARNVAVASLIAVPGMAVGAAGLGSIDGLRRSRGALGAIAVCVVAGCVFGVASLTGPDAELNAYPEDAVTWLESQGLLDDHLVARDYVGNYLEARYGPQQLVFIDDRVDMFPEQVVQDSVVLLRAGPRWEQVLDRYEAGAVLWRTDEDLAGELRASPHWQPAYEDATWTVFLRE